jgi:hypothetical protein
LQGNHTLKMNLRRRSDVTTYLFELFIFMFLINSVIKR